MPTALPGNESMNIRGCLKRLDDLITYIKGSIDRTFRAYGVSSEYSFCKYQTWMACLVTRMKQEYGRRATVHLAKADLEAGIDAPFSRCQRSFYQRSVASRSEPPLRHMQLHSSPDNGHREKTGISRALGMRETALLLSLGRLWENASISKPAMRKE